MSNDDGYIELVDEFEGGEEGTVEEPIDLSRYAENMVLDLVRPEYPKEVVEILEGYLKSKESVIGYCTKEDLGIINMCMDELQILRGVMARGKEKYVPPQVKDAIKLIRDALLNEIIHVIQMSKSRNGNERKTQATHIHISYTGMPDEHPAIPTPEKTRFQFFKRRRW